MVGVTSQLYNIEQIVKEDYGFNIPIYQRLYVWSEQQVKTLFEDLHTAFSTKKELYYIGGIIVVKNPNGNFDLVDGQQRFTTLWLLSNELKNILNSFIRKGNSLRLHFSIRENVTSYLTNIEDEINLTSDESDYADLIKMSTARKTLQKLIDQYLLTVDSKKDLAAYISTPLHMTLTNKKKQKN